jgi:F0F1-type ATP synthase membrane subunit b/b'
MATSATNTTAHTEVPGGHAKCPFPPFDPNVFAPQLIWLALTFGALYFLMSRIALPRIENILEARRARIAADVDDAASMQGKAQAAGAAYEKTLADAKASAQATAQSTRDKLAADSAAKRKTLEDRAYDELVTELLLQQEYKRRGITVTDDEILEAAGPVAVVEALSWICHERKVSVTVHPPSNTCREVVPGDATPAREPHCA